MVNGSGMDEVFRVRFSSEEINALREALSDMVNPVTAFVFIDDKCRYCRDTVELMDIISRVSPKSDNEKLLKLVVIHRKEDREGLFEKFGVYRVPTVALLNGYIKYVGMPAGEEIRSLVETIIRLSTGDSGLSANTKNVLANLKGKVVIDVFVTPICPYCPYAALLANMFAFESYVSGNKSLRVDIIEAFENPDIADRYNVFNVPTIVVNNVVEFIGVPTEQELLSIVLKHSQRSYTKELFDKAMEELRRSLERGNYDS